MEIRKIIRESVIEIKKRYLEKPSITPTMGNLSPFTGGSLQPKPYEKGEEIVSNHILPNGPLKRVGKLIGAGVLDLAISVSVGLLIGGIITATVACPVAGVMIGSVMLLHMAVMFLALLALIACIKFISGIPKVLTKEPVIEIKDNIIQDDLKYAKFFLLRFIQNNYPEINKEELSKALDYELLNAHLCFRSSTKAKNTTAEI